MMRVLAFAFALLVSAGTAAQLPSTAPAAWQKVAGVEGSFTVEMPGAPKYSTTPMKSPAGEDYVMHVYLLDLGGTAYIAQTTVYPASVNLSNPRVNLQSGLDNAARQMSGGKWAEVAWVTFGGQPAVDSIGAKESLTIRSFSVISGRRIVVLTYAGPMGSARSADVTRFLGSLAAK